MAYQFSVDDVRFLSGNAGADALDRASALPLTEATLLTDLTTLRRSFGHRAAPVAETNSSGTARLGRPNSPGVSGLTLS